MYCKLARKYCKLAIRIVNRWGSGERGVRTEPGCVEAKINRRQGLLGGAARLPGTLAKTLMITWSVAYPRRNKRERKFPLPRSILQARTSRGKVDTGPGLGQQEARQERQPQIPTERETEARCHRGRCQQSPCLPLLPAKGWPLPYRKIPPVDDQTPGHEVLVVPVQHPDP